MPTNTPDEKAGSQSLATHQFQALSNESARTWAATPFPLTRSQRVTLVDPLAGSVANGPHEVRAGFLGKHHHVTRIRA